MLTEEPQQRGCGVIRRSNLWRGEINAIIAEHVQFWGTLSRSSGTSCGGLRCNTFHRLEASFVQRVPSSGRYPCPIYCIHHQDFCEIYNRQGSWGRDATVLKEWAGFVVGWVTQVHCTVHQTRALKCFVFYSGIVHGSCCIILYSRATEHSRSIESSNQKCYMVWFLNRLEIVCENTAVAALTVLWWSSSQT